MSTDVLLRSCPPAEVRAALAALVEEHPELSCDPPARSPGQRTFRLGVLGVPALATLTLDREGATVSGRGPSGPLLAWLGQALVDLAGTGQAWDPQEDAPLARVPAWEQVLALVRTWTAEEPAPPPRRRAALDQASGFLDLLVERGHVELAEGDRASLLAEVGRALGAPPRERVRAVEELLLRHPLVDEVYGDSDEIAAAVEDWG